MYAVYDSTVLRNAYFCWCAGWTCGIIQASRSHWAFRPGVNGICRENRFCADLWDKSEFLAYNRLYFSLHCWGTTTCHWTTTVVLKLSWAVAPSTFNWRIRNISRHLGYAHLKALVFLYAFEEAVDCHLLSSFCDDSNLHISLFKYVLSTMGVSKESISKFLIANF